MPPHEPSSFLMMNGATGIVPTTSLPVGVTGSAATGSTWFGWAVAVWLATSNTTTSARMEPRSQDPPEMPAEPVGRGGNNRITVIAMAAPSTSPVLATQGAVINPHKPGQTKPPSGESAGWRSYLGVFK